MDDMDSTMDSYENSTIASNCTIIIQGRQVDFDFDRGWEGIPFNFCLNSIVFVVFMCLFAVLRREAWDKRKLSHTKIGWLQFIYGDRQSLPQANVLDIRHTERHSHHGTSSPLLLPPPAAGKKKRKRKVEENGANPHVVLPMDDVPVEENGHSSHYRPLAPDGDNGSADIPAAPATNRYIRSMSIASVTQMGRRLVDSIMIRDEDIQRVKGIDAVQYLMFQRYILLFLTVLSAVCLLVILPINLQGTFYDSSKPYARTTISNLETTSSLLWAHGIMSVLVVPFGVILMWHFSRSIKYENERIARRTLLIRRIPKAKAKKDVIISFLAEKFPDIVIDGVQLLYDIRKLRALYAEHVNVVNAIGYCDEYLREYNEPCEIRPYFLGLFGGLCCCCKCCGKSDGLTFYREEEIRTERALEKEFKDTISNPLGSAFITFKTEKMAQTVFKYLRKHQRKSCNILTCCGACTFGSAGCRDELSIGRWQTSYAPDPEDVNWDDISADLSIVWLRRIFINLILFVVFLFLTTPPILINILNKADWFGTLTTGLRNVSPTLTAYVSPLLLIMVALILPVIVTFASTYLPYKTISEQNHSTMWKVFLFLVLMVLVLPSLDLTSASALIQMLYSVDHFRWECLFPVGNGAFFINYVLQSALLGNAFELLRLPELFIYFYYTLIWTKSPAEYENARQQILFDFQFGVRYARFLLIFVMVVSYSLSCPLIAPCGLLYMGLKHVVDKYNIYYVYVPSKINDQIHSTAIMFFHIGLLTMQFQVFTFFFLRDKNQSGVTQMCLISVVVAWIFFLSHFCFNCFKSLSNSAGAIRKPNPKLDKSEFCACLYLPPVLYELNEYGIRAEAHNYGSMHHGRSTNDSHSDIASTSGSTAADA